MGSLPPDRATISRLRKLPLPRDYLSEARTSPDLWPERILCFTRKSLLEDEKAQTPTRHHHHRHVLVVPWQGRGRFDVDERNFSLAPGNALLIFPFQFHHLHHFQEGPVLWQFITFELRASDALDSLTLQPLRRMAAGDRDLLSAFTHAWTSLDEGTGELAPWLSLILDRLRKAPPVQPHKNPKGAAWSPIPENSLMAIINRQCLPRLDQIFGLKDLAARVGISESHLRARFREETGISLGRHVQQLRLQKAMGLLAQSKLSVTRIAEHCGFESVFTFSRAFRRMAGISAMDYRRRLKRVPSKKINKASV